MPPEIIVTSANLCQFAVPLIGLFAYLPQWIKLCRTKSSADISLRAWWLWTVSSVFALYYAVVQLLLNSRGWPLVASSTFSLLAVIVTVVLIVRYRPGRDAMPKPDDGER